MPKTFRSATASVTVSRRPQVFCSSSSTFHLHKSPLLPPMVATFSPHFFPNQLRQLPTILLVPVCRLFSAPSRSKPLPIVIRPNTRIFASAFGGPSVLRHTIAILRSWRTCTADFRVERSSIFSQMGSTSGPSSSPAPSQPQHHTDSDRISIHFLSMWLCQILQKNFFGSEKGQ